MKLENATVLPNEFLDHPDVDCYDIAVYAMICRYRGRDNRSFPSIDTIARRTKLSEKKVRLVVNHLVELGFISKDRNGKNNVYTILPVGRNEKPESDTDKQTVCCSEFNNKQNNKTDITSAVRENLESQGITVDDSEIEYAVTVAKSRPGIYNFVRYACGVVKKRIEQGVALISKTSMGGFGVSNTRGNDYYWGAWAKAAVTV